MTIWFEIFEIFVQPFDRCFDLFFKGCKISKSLKDNVAVRDALNRYTARRLRLAFCCIRG
jgi:leucyl-tRNA synthetase